MDVYDVLLQAGLVTAGFVAYILIFKGKTTKKSGHYKQNSWNYPLKLLCARYIVRGWKKRLRAESPSVDQRPFEDLPEGYDSWTLRASTPDGTSVLLVLRKLCGEEPLAEICVFVRLPNGTSYKLPRHPDSLVSAWDSNNLWKAGGLTIQVLEPDRGLRVLYNGMLLRTDTNTLHHARLNLIWVSASDVTKHPGDWNNSLAAHALASEPWRDDDWPKLLDRWGDGGKLQWYCTQGWFEVGEAPGISRERIWLRSRGVSERWWSLQGYQGLRRSFSLMITARDGTAIYLRAVSYRNAFNCLYTGCVRLPNTKVETISSTDLILEDFCERKYNIPPKYTIHVFTDNRSFKIILDINSYGERVMSAVPYQQEVYYRVISGIIDGSQAGGILELGYESSVIREPTVYVAPPPLLQWSTIDEVADVGFCANFHSQVAKCPDFVGGKGASLALLASVQEAQGYKVPPGFCLTSKAFEKHLEQNIEIIRAIREIELQNIDYDENIFQNKCERATKLIKATEIQGALRETILEHLSNLRKIAERDISNPIRFAVRSSAVGEDSEALSAAGQNDTVLGCVDDSDVLKAVLTCWASLFSFTSAQYRRQNGQQCMSGVGVVIQVLVSPRAAGVLFTRHPQNGDPSRILITANYGLGESVVSGSVEPDTYIVSRGLNNELAISSIELGSKKHFISALESGTITKQVSEHDQSNACLSNDEVLLLAKLAVNQEELWGAPRDIEWAINKDGVYLLQARPITSLEMWSEEELLHELDDPIMSEEDLITFANTGEVLPKPMSPLNHGLLFVPLNKGMGKMIGNTDSIYDLGVGLTSYRGMLNMYTSMYRRIPPTLDISVRMMEMAVHGHLIADERIHAIAVHRNPPSKLEQIMGIVLLIKTMLLSNWYVKNAIKFTAQIDIHKQEINDIDEFLTAIQSSQGFFEKISFHHVSATSASSASQIVTMSILLEKAQEFTNEHCNDLGVMLSCGDAVSADMPSALEALAKGLSQSGRFEDFKKVAPEKGMKWLKDNLPEIHRAAEDFLNRHGHRAVMEFDIATVPWVINPTGFIVVLQSMKASFVEKPKAKTDEEIISSLVTPKKSGTRKILRWMLPICRNMVSRREKTKSQLILGVHKIRLAVRKLGQMMVREWMIPSMDLVFYFRLVELQNYIKTRDPALLRKAIQRRKYFPKWGKFKFAELHEGWPEPMKIDGPRLTRSDTKLQATPVCGGEIVARACVIQDLSQINQLQHGDMLITHSTDIGWSPYFPLIAGIVTELGGLISHGAVIARECGLPCIVGATGATDTFSTGDLLRMSGTTGLIEKVVCDNKETTEAKKN